MFEVNPETKEITLHRGDTGEVIFNITGVTLDPEVDRVLFSMRNSSRVIVKQDICIPEDGTITVKFYNGDTDQLPGGKYEYDLRIAISPEYDSEGHIIDVDYDNGGAVRTPGSPYRITVLDTVGII